MKILKKKKKKKIFFFFFFLRLGFFFSNWEKSHLNPIGKGAEFRPLRTPKKISEGICKYVLERVSFGSKDCTKELKLECAYFMGQTS